MLAENWLYNFDTSVSAKMHSNKLQGVSTLGKKKYLLIMPFQSWCIHNSLDCNWPQDMHNLHTGSFTNIGGIQKLRRQEGMVFWSNIYAHKVHNLFLFTSALSICPDKILFVQDKIRFVQGKLILSMTKYLYSRTKILSMASNKFPQSKN